MELNTGVVRLRVIDANRGEQTHAIFVIPRAELRSATLEKHCVTWILWSQQRFDFDFHVGDNASPLLARMFYDDITRVSENDTLWESRDDDELWMLNGDPLAELQS